MTKKTARADETTSEVQTLKELLRFFVDREWYTNSDGQQEQVFAISSEELEAWRAHLKDG